MFFAEILFNSRAEKKVTLKDLSHKTGIDIGLLSKYENGDRLPSRAHLQLLIETLGVDEKSATSAWLGEKVYKIIDNDNSALEALQVAESKIRYGISKRSENKESLSESLQKLLAQCDELKTQWSAMRPLNATQLRKMEEYFNLNYTYESNRIEGNTLTLQETYLVLNDGITVGGKTMREHLEVVNHSEAIGYLSEIIKEKLSFTERILKQIHYLILKGIDRENAGVYRSVAVRITGSAHLPPEPYMLTRMMEEVFEFYEANRKIIHPVVLAAEMHERIVRIHPFIDGNGRTTRLVMNLILMQNGFPIANIKGDNTTRMAYYAALENAVTDEKQSFHSLIAETVIASLNEHISLSR